MLARSSLICTAAFLSACTGSPSPSGLERRNAAPEIAAPKPAEASPAPGEPTAPAPTASPTSPTSPTPPSPAPGPGAADVAAGQLTAEPPAGTELQPVRLALKDNSVYQITTIGQVAFSGVAPSGFAREERVELDACEGADAARKCRLTHRYVHFEAEPPNGRVFEGDERKVDKLVTRHGITSNGARAGEAEITGDAEQLAAKDGVALREAHRFYCIRFPDVPIGVGAKWKDTCHMRTGGVIDTREVIWELTRISEDDQGRRRADFTYLGRYVAPGEPTERTGTVQGVLYYLLDAGEPHSIKEQIVTRRGADSSFATTTTITYQFARLITDKAGKSVAVRTDGQPFPKEAPKPAPADPAANLSPAPQLK